jgi:hypothetical protein
MGPGESKSEENICGSDTKVFFFGIPKHHAVPFNELEISKIKAAKEEG